MQILDVAADQLAWEGGEAAPGEAAPREAARGCWRGARRLLLHRHLWVRKAAGRLLGAGLAADPMLATGGEFAAGGEPAGRGSLIAGSLASAAGAGAERPAGRTLSCRGEHV